MRARGMADGLGGDRMAAVQTNEAWEAFVGGVRRSFDSASDHALILAALAGLLLLLWANVRLARWLEARGRAGRRQGS